MGYATLENIISIRSIRMAVQAEPNKKGIISLAVIIVLMILVTALSNPIYQALSKKGAGVTYTASGQGYGGEVIITLTVEDERISDLTAQSAEQLLLPERYRQAFRRLWNRLRRLWVRM